VTFCYFAGSLTLQREITMSVALAHVLLYVFTVAILERVKVCLPALEKFFCVSQASRDVAQN
jgi:hypothetical protein